MMKNLYIYFLVIAFLAALVQFGISVFWLRHHGEGEESLKELQGNNLGKILRLVKICFVLGLALSLVVLLLIHI